MTRSEVGRLTALLAATALATGGAVAQTPPQASSALAQGAAVFEARCKTCHEPSIENAPERSELAKLPKAEIVAALTSGLMVPNAVGLTPDDIDAVAAYLTTPGAPATKPAA